MGTATSPETTQYSLSSPPPGASFVYDEVKTDHGKRSLGEVPLLQWGEDETSINNAIAFYGHEGIANFINGTSLKVSIQGIARRLKTRSDKNGGPASDEEIAKEMIDFRPGKREGGQSTPASQAANRAKKIAQQTNAVMFGELLKKIESKEIDPALLRQMGFDPEQFYSVAANEADTDEEENGEGEGETA